MERENLNPKSYKKKIVWKIALNASIGSFIFGYNTGVFNSNQLNVSATLGWEENKELYISVMAALMPLGALCGALIAGSISNRIGRRKALMAVDIINIVGGLLFIIPNTYVFGIGRLVTGFTSGCFSALTPLYIGEISPADMMGTIGSLIGLIIDSGIMFAYGMAIPLPTGSYNSNPMNYWWIVMFAFQGIFTLFQLIVLWKVYDKDTPKWYLSQKQEKNAIRSLMQFYEEEEALEVIKSLQAMMEADKETVLKTIDHQGDKIIENLGKDDGDFTWKQLFMCSKKSRKMLRIGILIAIFQVAAGIDALFAYTTNIFSKLGGGEFESRIYTFVFGIVAVLSTIAVFPIINLFNRRILIIIGNIGTFITMLILGLLSEFFPDTGPIPSLICILLFVFFWSIGIGTICWLYLGEILTARAMSICVGANWTIIIIVLFTFPHISSMWNIGVAFWIYSLVSIVGIGYVMIEFVETRGLNMAEIREAFKKLN